MLGGLNSLIPKKSDDKSNGLKPENIQPQNTAFSSLKKQDDSAMHTHSNAVEKEVAAKKHIFHQPAKRTFSHDAIFHIEVDKIQPNPFQPRKNFNEESLKELAGSISEFGILQPVIVSKIEKETPTGTAVEYQLIAGERRLMAAKMLGLERVPAIIRKIDQKAEQLEMAVIENLQRQNLDLIETARAYARLQEEFGLTQREIAQRLGKSRESVANVLRLLNLTTELQEALSKNQINESQARLLLSINNPLAQKQLFNEILANNLTVREVNRRVKRIKNSGRVEDQIEKFFGEKDFEIKNLEERLKEFLGTDVKIIVENSLSGSRKGESGKIVIAFYSPEEIYGIINKIHPDNNEI